MAFGGVVIDVSVECAELSGTGGRVVSVSSPTPDTVLVVVEFDEAHVALISPDGVERHTAASFVRLPFSVRDEKERRSVRSAALHLSLSGAPIDVTAQYRFAPNELVAAVLVSPTVRFTIAASRVAVGNAVEQAS